MSRVLHVIPALWSGAGRVVTRLCQAQRLTHEVAIATASRSGADADWTCYRDTLADQGVAHYPIDFLARDQDVFWTSVEALRSLITRWTPDVVHAHAGVPSAGTAIVRDQTRAAFRFVTHCYSWRPHRPAWMDQMDLWGFAQADAVLCSARAYERRLREGGVDAKRLIYLPWGLAMDEIDRVRRQVSPQRARPVIGCVGRLEPRKGQLQLCRAVARYLRRDPRITLELVGPVGDPVYAGQINRYLAAAGLEDAVSLLGQVDDAYRLVASWDLAVSLSSDEGQGLAVLEAMALGTPVLARSSPGVEDFLRDGENGFVVKGDSPREVSDAVGRALHASSGAPAVSQRARRFVRQHYDWARTVSEVENAYVSRPLTHERRVAA